MKFDLNYTHIKVDNSLECENARKNYQKNCFFKNGCVCYHESYRGYSEINLDLGNKKIFIEPMKKIVKLHLI